MSHKSFNLKLTCTVLIGLLCVITFYGCSKIRNFTATDSSVQNQHTDETGQQKAYHEFSSKIRAHQESPESIYRRACYFQERKKHRLALLEFKRIIEIDPSYVMAYNGMGISYDSLGEFSVAADSYKSALELNPKLDYVYNNLGYSYLLQNELDSAIKAFKKAIALKENDKKYHNNLGMAYAKKGIYPLAFEEFTLAAGERAARHNLALFRKENNSHPHIADNLATLESSGKIGANDSSQMNLDSESDKSMGPKLNEELGEAGLEAILKSSTKKDQENSQKSPNQEHGTFNIQVAAFKYLENAIKLKENLSKIGYRGHINVAKREDSPLYVVKVGSYNSRTAAAISAERMEAELGIEPLVISADHTHYIQVATFKYLENAIKLKENLSKIGYRGHINVAKREDSPLYVIKVGSFNSRMDAAISAERMEAELGIEPLIISVNDTEITSPKKIENTGKKDLHIMPKAAKSETLQIQDSLTRVGIEVSNGNGVNRMARKIAQYLLEKGYVISRITNASHFTHAKTKIYYCEGYLQDAYCLAKEIPGWNEMKKTEMPEKLPVKIRVLIGKDLVSFAGVIGRGKGGDYS